MSKASFHFNMGLNAMCIALYGTERWGWALFHLSLMLLIFVVHVETTLIDQMLKHRRANLASYTLETLQREHALIFSRPLGALRLYIEKKLRKEPWP